MARNRDNFSYSSRVAATFCFVFTATLHGGTPASMRIRKLPNIVPSVSCKGSPLQYPAHNLRGLSFPHSSFRRSSVEHQLGFVSPSLEAQHMCSIFTPLPPCARKKSSVPFATNPCTAVDAGRCSAREIVIHPHSPQVVADVMITLSPPTSVESYQSDTTRCRRDGRGSREPSHHELSTFTDGSYKYYLLCAEYLDLEQSANHPSLASSKSSRRSHVTLVCLSLYYSESLAIPRLLHLHTHPALHSRTETVQPLK